MDGACLRISNSTIQAINIYRQAADAEKFIDGMQVRITPTQKKAIRKICNENGLDVSTFGREAVDFYIDLFPYKQKIRRHRRLLRKILEELA